VMGKSSPQQVDALKSAINAILQGMMS